MKRNRPTLYFMNKNRDKKNWKNNKKKFFIIIFKINFFLIYINKLNMYETVLKI